MYVLLSGGQPECAFHQGKALSRATKEQAWRRQVMGARENDKDLEKHQGLLKSH